MSSSTTKPKLSPELQAISDERAIVYGDPLLSHEAIADAWQAYLERYFGMKMPRKLEAYGVAHLMTIMKVLRGATAYKDDNFDDGHVYLTFAQDFQQGWDKKNATKRVSESSNADGIKGKRHHQRGPGTDGGKRRVGRPRKKVEVSRASTG